MGWREANSSDVDTLPNAGARSADPTHFLAASCDFNGDGRSDEARILLPPDGQDEIRIVVVAITTKIDTYVLGQFDRKALSDIAIEGIAQRKGEMCNALRIFRFSGGSETQMLRDDTFEVVGKDAAS